MTPPEITRATKHQRYTEIHFLLPTKWDTGGVMYSAHFASNDQVFCRWYTEVGRNESADGHCSALTPQKYKNRRVKMYLYADSLVGQVRGDDFWVTFR